MPSAPPDLTALRLWRHSVKVTTLWALLLILLFVTMVWTQDAARLESLVLGPKLLGLSAAQVLTAGNLLLGIYLLLDLTKAWRMRGPVRRGHVAGVVLAIVLVCALQVGVEVVAAAATRLARGGA